MATPHHYRSILNERDEFDVHGAVTMNNPHDQLTRSELALLATSFTVMTASFMALVSSI